MWLSPNTLSRSHVVLSDTAKPGWNAEWQQVFNTDLWRLEMMLQRDQEHCSYLMPAGVARSRWMPWSRKSSPLFCHCHLPRSISYCQCSHTLQVTLLCAVFPHNVIGNRCWERSGTQIQSLESQDWQCFVLLFSCLLHAMSMYCYMTDLLQFFIFIINL